MTSTVDLLTGPSVEWPDRAALATAPWPYVERRTVGRPAPAGEAASEPIVLPAQRAPSSSEQIAPTATGARDEVGWRRRAVATVFVSDALAGGIAGLIAYEVRFPSTTGTEAWYLLGVVLIPMLLCTAIGIARGYQTRFLGASSEEVRLVLRATVGMGVATALVSYALRAELPRGYLLLVCTTFAFLAVLGRWAHLWYLQRARRAGRCLHNVLLVGDSSLVADLVGQLQRESDGGMRVVGACVPGGSSELVEQLGVQVLGDLHVVAGVVRQNGVDSVAVAPCAAMRGPALRRLAWELEGTGVDLMVAPGLVEVAGPRLHIRPVCGLPLLHVEEPELSGGRRLVKGAMDRGGALLLLLVLSPLLLAIAVVIRTSTPGPVLFSQTRVGCRGRTFRMWKFRSMHADAERSLADVRALNCHGDEVLFKIPRDPRVTPVGRWLRRFSADELPQLFNVLRGEMSLVGPRPPLAGEVARYGVDVHRRLLVKPGLTGLWQINGRSDLSWDESIRLDLRYVENWSLSLDVLILCRTMTAVVRGHGAY